jgi:hypothetical protein|tara:strand:- start:154 stop:339 length:186 start_codon:yes stop_codon:yes gene_type:complete
MSKVLYLLEDYGDLLTYRHEKWIEEEMKRQEELEDENTTDDDRLDSYVNPDGDFTHDDIPF